MVHYYRYNQLKKGEYSHYHHDQEDMEALGLLVCGNSGFYKRKIRPKFVSLFILSVLCCCLILAPYIFSSSSAFSLFYSFVGEKEVYLNDSLCSSVANGSMCCDRTSFRSDICIMKGDVRTKSVSSSLFLYTSRNSTNFINEEEEFEHENVRPYTRKWETSVMDSIDQLELISKPEKYGVKHKCDVKHDVPAVFFSTGGYTGNVYHEFNDGILPLYITSQHLKKNVVFVILEYHEWWMMKYGDIISQLSKYPVIDFSSDKRTHCFPEAIVGLRIHDELTVDPMLMQGNKSIVDFRNLLDKSYWPRIKSMIQDEERKSDEKLKQKVHSSPSSSEKLLELRKGVEESKLQKPKLVILSRNGSRGLTNEDMLVIMAKEIGFRVRVLKPDRTTELASIYRVLNSSDVMIGVHGAAMTHFLFMKPGSVFIQVIPLGTEWAAEAYYGEPAKKLGLKYFGYQILPKESSLYGKYDKNDPILQDPASIAKKGWQYTKSIYLDDQNVRLNLKRFHEPLLRAYQHSTRRMSSHSQ